jgi:hypothetical protein
VTSIGANSLPPPHQADVADDSARLVTVDGQLPFGRIPDPQVQPRRWRLSWTGLVRETAMAIDAHFAAYPDAVWQLRLPGGEVARVQWTEPPTIQWANPAFASSVAGEVEEALAFD